MSASNSNLASQVSSIINELINQRLNEGKISSILQEVGNYGVSVARANSPVRTGRLRDGNQMEVSDTTLKLFNDVEYAGIVNGGSSRQRAQPFFDTAAAATEQKLNQDLTSNL